MTLSLTRSRRFHPAVLFLALTLVVGLAVAPAAAQLEDERLQELLKGENPSSLEELAAMEVHFQELATRVIPAVVGVRVGASQGSGVIISNDGYVLTAGHVVGEPGQEATFIMPDGSILRGETLGANNGIDSGLMKITDDGEWDYLDMGNSAELGDGQWVMAIGHPGGYQQGRSPVVRVGRVLSHSNSAIRTDCVLVGGDSGGPLFDMEGQVVGINSRIGGEVTTNIHVPVNTFGETWDRLAAGEKWGRLGNIQLRGPYIGVTRDPESEEAKIAEVTEDGPADKAGIKAGDTIIEFDGRKIDNFQSLRIAILSRQPGDEVVVAILRDGERLELPLTVGRR